MIYKHMRTQICTHNYIDTELSSGYCGGYGWRMVIGLHVSSGIFVG